MKCPISPAQIRNPRRQSKWNEKDYGGKDLWNRWVLSLEWKTEGVIDGESENGDCDEVICVGWDERRGQRTEWGWRNEEGSWSNRWGDAYVKERLVICNEEDTDGRARVTTDEVNDVLEIRLWGNHVGWLWWLIRCIIAELRGSTVMWCRAYLRWILRNGTFFVSWQLAIFHYITGLNE